MLNIIIEKSKLCLFEQAFVFLHVTCAGERLHVTCTGERGGFCHLAAEIGIWNLLHTVSLRKSGNTDKKFKLQPFYCNTQEFKRQGHIMVIEQNIGFIARHISNTCITKTTLSRTLIFHRQVRLSIYFSSVLKILSFSTNSSYEGGSTVIQPIRCWLPNNRVQVKVHLMRRYVFTCRNWAPRVAHCHQLVNTECVFWENALKYWICVISMGHMAH